MASRVSAREEREYLDRRWRELAAESSWRLAERSWRRIASSSEVVVSMFWFIFNQHVLGENVDTKA
jgi:hypothetical protein